MTKREDTTRLKILIELLNDMGLDAYDAGDRISGFYPTWAYDLAEVLYDLGWRKNK
jgi:hypothetical protein